MIVAPRSLVVVAFILFLPLVVVAQVSTPNAPTAPQAPVAPTVQSPVVSTPNTSTTNTSTSQGQGQYAGTWVVERAIYDYLMQLRDVTGRDGTYYQRITLGPNGQGTILYRGKTVADTMEYEFRDQGLTIAYGSRLKPTTDLFTFTILDDGAMLLKSRRLGTMNGTMLYILKKENS